MSVRHSLLAILDQGACYGYQLRAEFDRRTGSTWPLNVGQIYNTLDRLDRDGLVEKGATDEQGHVYWQITDAGRAEVSAWMARPIERPRGTRDELAIKLAVAVTLPDVDVAAVLTAQRAASAARLSRLRSEVDDDAEDAAALARSVILDAMIGATEAELTLLDRTEARLAQHPRDALTLSAHRPRRGRPSAAA